jgi:hypothetical protein
MKATNGSGESRHQRAEETRLTGMLNILVFLATAAVAYSDRIVAPDISLGYLYVLPIALSALVNPFPVTLGSPFVPFSRIFSTRRLRFHCKSGWCAMR